MKEIITYITSQLIDLYPQDEAQALAWWIVEESTGLSRNEILTGCKGTKNIPNLQTIIDRLHHFEPIQYIFGRSEWYGLDLKVTPDTLIPRPETAELVDRINHEEAHTNNLPLRVLDIGTGSGCIAIALKKAHPEWEVMGIDISEGAIEVAKENAKRNEVEVEFRVADIFRTLKERELRDSIDKNPPYDIVVSNPPYICEREKEEMRPNVLDYEPHSALFVPDEDPLKFYRRIASLHLGSLLFFEINEAYPKEIATMLSGLNYSDIQLSKDVYGKARIIQARSTR
ncbi:MAG: peptide chain release factor N(5)-glutamine methyltransferase [Paludibacteraceae bacterium]|nr:peptide chain release factor N(5)-glutamine methyltransferase [Paludibacteraceae bacterium]